MKCKRHYVLIQEPVRYEIRHARGGKLGFWVCEEVRFNFAEQFLFMIFGIGDEKFSE